MLKIYANFIISAITIVGIFSKYKQYKKFSKLYWIFLIKWNFQSSPLNTLSSMDEIQRVQFFLVEAQLGYLRLELIQIVAFGYHSSPLTK